MRCWIAFAALGGCTPDDAAQPAVLPEATSTDGFSSWLDEDVQSIPWVAWEQADAATVHVEYSFEEGSWLSSPARELAAGHHEELLLGIPYGSDVTWKVVSTDDSGSVSSPEQDLTNGEVPDDMPEANVRVSDPSGYDPGSPYVLLSLAVSRDNFGGPWWVLIVDRQGRPVWGMKSPSMRISMHPRIAKDGRSLFLDDNSFWATFDGGANADVRQVLIDGTVLRTFETPGEHHPFTDLPDGSVAYGAMVWPSYATEQLVVVHPDGSTDVAWDCADWLAAAGIDDFCASNTLNYDDATGKYLFSFWSFESIVAIDAATGTVDETWGHLAGSWAFDPPDSAFWWQHGGTLTDAGTLLTSSDLTRQGVETVVREYEIDAANQTLHEVWDFGIGEGLYGYEMGEAHRLPNGNTLHNYGELARLREATPDREVVWDVSWPSAAVGRSTTLADLYALAPSDRP